MRDEDAVEAWRAFLADRYGEEIMRLARGFPRDEQELVVDISDVLVWRGWDAIETDDEKVADRIHEQPELVRERAEAALARVDLPVDVDLSRARVRFENVATAGIEFDVGAYDGQLHVGRLIGIRGQVNRRSKKRPKLTQATFECQRCGTPVTVEGAREPHECAGCERQGPFRFIQEQSQFVDHQLVRLQLPPEKTNGQTSEAIDVELSGDLVNMVAPGDRVTVDATLGVEVEDEEHGLYEFVADADAVEVEETDFEDITVTDEQRERIEEIADDNPFEQLVGSLAPSLFGLETIKLALVLQLFGGVEKQRQDGSTGRGNSHVLLVGDPGVGKTELLNYVADVAPRSVRSDGTGSTAAGLTASAVRDDFGPGGEWTIEGGSIVKAHRGIACVDELDDMDEEDRSALHTALESQEVPVAKAGINATLPAKTKLLAAANPEYGRFDPYEPIDGQIDIDPALISRFDLVFTLRDQPNRDTDEDIIDHKLDSAHVGQRRQAGAEVTDELAEAHEPTISEELFRAYVAHARDITPELTAEAKDVIRETFLELRLSNLEGDSSPDDEPIPVTFRKQDAIIRFAEASARVRLSEEITAADAERALALIRQSMEDVGKDPDTGEFDADVIETGASRSQQQRIKTVESLVGDLEDEEYEGAPIEEVVSAAVEEGMTEQQALKTLEELAKKGEVYEPAENHYRTT